MTLCFLLKLFKKHVSSLFHFQTNAHTAGDSGAHAASVHRGRLLTTNPVFPAAALKTTNQVVMSLNVDVHMKSTATAAHDFSPVSEFDLIFFFNQVLETVSVSV